MKFFALVLLLSFASIANNALAGSVPDSFPTGVFVCSEAGKDSTDEMLMLWPDGHWTRGRLFDAANYRVSWTKVKTRGYEGRLMFLLRAPKTRGVFQVDGGKLMLRAYVPGFVFNGAHTGPVSLGTPEVPDAALAYDRSFQIATDEHTLTEILPFNSQREPIRCHSGFTN